MTLGNRGLLFEEPSFPIDPDADTIENCRRRVERDADILVLIIGGRLGSVDKATAKSVTNLEYLAARAKGIPIYAFVEKRVLTLMSGWEDNKSADFSRDIDDVRLFEFIHTVRSTHRIWTKEFETAQDIINILRTQLAYMFRDGLQIRLKLRRNDLTHELLNLSGAALRTALERPDAWEYRLFAEALIDEVKKSQHLRRAHQLGIAFGTGDTVRTEEFAAWMAARIHELTRMVLQVETLVNEELQKGFGPPGVAGDPSVIVFVARQIGHFYAQAMEWSRRIRCSHVTTECRPVGDKLATFTDELIDEIEAFGARSLEQIESAFALRHEPGPRTIHMTMTFTMSKADEFSAALEQAMRELGIPY